MRRKVIASAAAVVLGLSATVGGALALDQEDGMFSRIQTVYRLVQSYHKDGADLDTFVNGAIKGGLEALGDDYTNYFTAEEFGDFLNDLNGSFTGIGAYLEQDGNYVVVAAPIKGSPAARAGLATGDRILEANGTSLVGATTDKAVSLIRGEEGTTVTLKIERPLENRTFTLTITRAEITIPEVDSRMLEDGVGYIELASFGDDAVADFYKAVDELKAQGAKGFVLDLRQNGGGYLDAAIDIASAFVPKGQPVVYEVGKNGKDVHTSSGRLINLPVSVLVDGGTASASEILSGAIQDYGVGPLVGVKTFGKGTVQSILTLTGGAGGMKVTVAEYLTPKERHVHGIGLTPDYVVEQSKPDPERVAPMEFKRAMLLSTVGLDVLYLQYRLEDLGYNVDADGFYGNKTASAVKQFAEENGLDPEKGVDARFIEVLNEKVAEHLRTAQQEDVQLQKAVEVLKERLK